MCQKNKHVRLNHERVFTLHSGWVASYHDTEKSGDYRRNYQSGAQKGKKYINSIVGRFVISLYFGQMQASCFPLLPVFMLS